MKTTNMKVIRVLAAVAGLVLLAEVGKVQAQGGPPASPSEYSHRQ